MGNLNAKTLWFKKKVKMIFFVKGLYECISPLRVYLSFIDLKLDHHAVLVHLIILFFVY